MDLSKFCQSCSMPLGQDPAHGGTESDGITKSAKYCSYCYDHGQFRTPDMTMGQMQVLVKQKLREKGMSGIKAWFYSLAIPRLERWKK